MNQPQRRHRLALTGVMFNGVETRSIRGRADAVMLPASRLLFLLLAGVIWLAGIGAAGAEQKNLLWRISNGKNSVFLLGSIHYLRKENYPLSPSIQGAFGAARRLVLEIDLNTLTPEAAQRVTAAKAFYRDGTDLVQNVSPETYQAAAKRATEFGLDLRLLNTMKPWFAALTLLGTKLRALGLDASLGVDRYLATEAKRRGKPTSGLETLEFQMGLMDQLSAKNQELMLRETLDEFDLLDQSINDIVQSWVNGDSDQLAKLLLAGMTAYPELYQKIIVDRNRRWLPEIETLIEQDSGALIVVGAAHLAGKDGIVEMLKTRGYLVEQK